MNSKTIVTVVTVVFTLLGETYNVWSRRKLKRQLEYHKAEIRRRDWTIAGSVVHYSKLNQDQKVMRNLILASTDTPSYVDAAWA